MKSFICTGLVILGMAVLGSAAVPKPAVVPGPDDWTLDVTYEHPQEIILKLGNEQKRFWYMIITLTNKTSRDVDFYPKCELMTDTFEVIAAGKGTPDAVFEQIKKRHQGRYPFLESLEKVGNKILQGEDNTKDVAIIWPDFDADARGITLFVGGLSNETTVVDHPVAKDAQGNPVKVFLRKTLELNYKIAGDPAFRSDAKLTFEGKGWVMR